MRNKIIFGFVIFVFALIFYGPSFLHYFELKIAPYGKNFYSINLNNGEYLFGRIKSTNNHWVVLSDVYYFQSFEIDGVSTKNLVPQVSNPLTNPTNLMRVNLDQIVSIEKIGKEAKVLEVINPKK